MDDVRNLLQGFVKRERLQHEAAKCAKILEAGFAAHQKTQMLQALLAGEAVYKIKGMVQWNEGLGPCKDGLGQPRFR